MPAEEAAKPEAVTAPPPVSHDEWHSEFTKRSAVMLSLPARRNPLTGYSRPAIERESVLQSLRCVVAHRVLHGLAPNDVAALKAAHEASPDKGVEFDKWALRHIDALIPEGVQGPVLRKSLALHATEAKLGEHRKALVEKHAVKS